MWHSTCGLALAVFFLLNFKCVATLKVTKYNNKRIKSINYWKDCFICSVQICVFTTTELIYLLLLLYIWLLLIYGSLFPFFLYSQALILICRENR